MRASLVLRGGGEYRGEGLHAIRIPAPESCRFAAPPVHIFHRKSFCKTTKYYVISSSSKVKDWGWLSRQISHIQPGYIYVRTRSRSPSFVAASILNINCVAGPREPGSVAHVTTVGYTIVSFNSVIETTRIIWNFEYVDRNNSPVFLFLC